MAAALANPLESEDHGCRGPSAAELVHRTSRSGLRFAAAMDHEISGPPGLEVDCESGPDRAAVTMAAHLTEGQTLSFVKYVGYGWSSVRSRQGLRDQAIAAVTAAGHAGWDRLAADQRCSLDDYWSRADVTLAADGVLERTIRFSQFHLLQATARRATRDPGQGPHWYRLRRSHVLGHRGPPHGRAHLPAARGGGRCTAMEALDAPVGPRSSRNVRAGRGCLPWRTISGQECSSYWPASTAAFHVNADIAHATLTYLDATQDIGFAVEVGLELLAETARLWMSLGHRDRRGRFRIAGVTGPDEYSALADDNLYTNLMAQRNLQGAVDTALEHRSRAEELGITESEIASWADAAASMLVPFDEHRRVHPQSLGFTDHEPWNFELTPPDHYPLMLHYAYFDLYRKQVVKQADVVLAMQLRPEAFDDEQRARNFAYYEAMTVRDSSLSAQSQGVVARHTSPSRPGLRIPGRDGLSGCRRRPPRHGQRPPPAQRWPAPGTSWPAGRRLPAAPWQPLRSIPSSPRGSAPSASAWSIGAAACRWS